MRLLPLLLLLPTLAEATPVQYVINFTVTTGIAPTGSFTYDPDTTAFTNFVVGWRNLVEFNFTQSANAPTVRNFPCLDGLTGAAATFALLSGSCHGVPGYDTRWIIFPTALDEMDMHFREWRMPPDGSGITVIAWGGVPAPSGQFGFAQGNWTIEPQDQPETFEAPPDEEPVSVSEPLSAVLILIGLAFGSRRRGLFRRTVGRTRFRQTSPHLPPLPYPLGDS